MARLLAGALVCVSVILAPTLATASAPPRTFHTGTTERTLLHPRASNVCSRVSASTVASIVGHSVPAGALSVVHLKPTAQNFETSGVELTCTYGSQSSLGASLKDVTLTYEVLTKPITTAKFQQILSRLSASAKFTFTAYAGLGAPGFYFSLTVDHITGRGVIGERGSTRYFGASVEEKGLPTAKIAALAKLAEKL